MKLDVTAFVQSLRFMIEGWLGIFLVMAVIIGCIYALNAVCARMEDRAKEKAAGTQEE